MPLFDTVFSKQMCVVESDLLQSEQGAEYLEICVQEYKSKMQAIKCLK